MPYGDQTPDTTNSSPSPYITASEFFAFVDPDLPAQCLSDTRGVKATVADMVDPTTVPGSHLKMILLAVSGQLEADALVGKRYAPESLAGLTGCSAARLKQILADLAVFACYSRRDAQMAPENVVARYQMARQVLDQLRTGDEIFALEETEDAGLPMNVYLNNDDYMRQNLLSVRWDRMFGQRQSTRRIP